VFPAASVAATVKVCEPEPSEVYVWLLGLVHAPGGAPSSWHWTLETASLTVKVKFADVWVVGLDGFEGASIATAIGVESRSTTDTVPVTVGPPGWRGYGG
jgi:hypothetical protein